MFRSWRNWRAARLTVRGWVVLVAIVVLPVTYQVTRSDAVGVVTQVNHYETPCQYQARTQRGIPPLSVDATRGLLGWTRQHMPGGVPDAELTDYWTAMSRCGRGDWDWDNKVRVAVEYIGN